jgi:hypothetical protein
MIGHLALILAFAFGFRTYLPTWLLFLAFLALCFLVLLFAFCISHFVHFGGSRFMTPQHGAGYIRGCCS